MTCQTCETKNEWRRVSCTYVSSSQLENLIFAVFDLVSAVLRFWIDQFIELLASSNMDRSLGRRQVSTRGEGDATPESALRHSTKAPQSGSAIRGRALGASISSGRAPSAKSSRDGVSSNFHGHLH